VSLPPKGGELAREFERMGMRANRHYFRLTLFGARAVVVGGVFVISPLTPLARCSQSPERCSTAFVRQRRRAAGRHARFPVRAGGFRNVRTSGPEPGLSRVKRSRSVTSSGAPLAGADATFAGRASR